MKLLVITLVTFVSISSLAQSARQYLDEKENLLPGPNGASYYRETEQKGNMYLVRDFYAAGNQLAMEASCSQVVPRLLYEGSYKTYHKNGEVMEEGNYKDNEKRGLWKSFYENGQQEKEMLYEQDKALYQQHWDESGNAQLVNGTGHYTQNKYVSIGVQYMEILDHLLIASYSVNPASSDTTYIVVQETASYKGGMPALHKSIAKTLRYPPDARRNGIEGKIFVEFIVERDGTVSDVGVIKGLEGGLNEEAERVMKLMNKWIPGKVKGRTVRQRMVLPIAFRLG